MPMTYRIDAEDGIVFMTAMGDVNFEEYRAFMALRDSDPNYCASMPAVFDARRARLSFSVDEVRELAQIARAQLPGKLIRRAIVVADDLEFGISKLFQILTNDARHQYEVFRDYESALDWVTGGVGS
jgi:hypothetical protein